MAEPALSITESLCAPSPRQPGKTTRAGPHRPIRASGPYGAGGYSASTAAITRRAATAKAGTVSA